MQRTFGNPWLYGWFQVRFGWFRVLTLVHVREVCVRRCGTKVLMFSKWVRETLEVTRLHLWVKGATVDWASLLFSAADWSTKSIPQLWIRGQRSLTQLQISAGPSLIQGTLPCLQTYTHTHTSPPEWDPLHLFKCLSANLVWTMCLLLLLRLGISKESRIHWLCCPSLLF